MAAELNVHIQADRFTLVGELDTHTSPQLASALTDVDGGSAVVLDVAGVSFISSAGLSVILNAQRSLTESGGSLRVEAPTAPVARMIELSGLAEAFGLS